jgi:putative transposase
LNDRRSEIIRPLLPDNLLGGRPRTVSLHKVLDAILYVTRSGCAWRLLPLGDFPPWQTVYGYFRRWTKYGTWQRVHDTLCADVRRKAGRHKPPGIRWVDDRAVNPTQPNLILFQK